MTSYEITQLSAIANAAVLPAVVLPVVDPNDTFTAPASPDGSNKRMTLSQLPIQFRVFHVDSYPGADPTGSTSSDAAFSAANAAAESAIVPSVSGGPTGGALVVYGPGVYQHSIDVVKVTDPRIGLVGAGKQATTLYTTGSGGDLVWATDTSPGRAGVQGSAPVGGFALYGWLGGAGLNLLHYGDRPAGTLTDITAGGAIGSGSKNFLLRNDNGGLSEGTTANLDSQQATIGFCFDGNFANGSFDYSSWALHGVCTTLGGTATLLQVINQAHLFGGQFALRGNIQSASSGVTATAIQIGNSGSDTARIVSQNLAIAIECDASTGSVFDLVTDGTSQAGIQTSPGVFVFLSAAGTFTAGSVGGSSVVSGSGTWSGPLFSSHGTLTALGTSAAGLVTYHS